MTADPTYGIPEFGMGDRMRLVLTDRGHTVHDAAEYFGVSRNTITNWLQGNTHPRRSDVRMWAMWLRVPEEWLRTGQAPRGAGPDDGLPQMDSNHQPFGSRLNRPHRGGHALAA